MRLSMIRPAALLALALAAAATDARPFSPCLSPYTFNEVFHQNPKPGILLMLIDTPDTTHERWKTTIWADPLMCAWINRKDATFVYADTKSDAGVLWLLDIERTPALVVFDESGERGRRYGIRSDDTAEETLYWISGVLSGDSSADQMAARLEENPDDFETRFKLIQELQRSGEDAALAAQYCWLLAHTGAWQQAAETHDASPANDAEFELGVLWFVSGLRENADLWSEPNWSRAISAGFRAPPTTKEAIKLAALRAPMLALRKDLETRVRADKASELDTLVLRALTMSQDEFRETLADRTMKAYPEDQTKESP